MMLDSDKQMMLGILRAAAKKAEKLNSIDEKRKLFYEALRSSQSFVEYDGEVDIESEEVNEIIVDNFLTINIEKPQIFEADGYTPWLDSARNEISWKFYDRYDEYLSTVKQWKYKTVSSINKSANIILDHMGNPKSEKLFNKKGLVIGDIQSGKTANYTALINKAIDAGYKIIIVLSGLTRDLRNQTQNRLDKEVLGYSTKTLHRGEIIGVGALGELKVEGLTYSDDKRDFGDMKKFFTTHVLDNSTNPIVAIVKKNKSILTNIIQFLTKSLPSCYTNEKLDIPVLIIDDEVDQASVDTKNGKEIEEASAINAKIREMLDKLNRYSYVGYTATPFANVFIDPDKMNDIYPKDFILTLPTDPDYCGIKEYFGIDETLDCEDVSENTDLVVNLDDYENLFDKMKLKSDDGIDELDQSIKDAIKYFIIAASVKKARGFKRHNSMLIHISMYVKPSTTLKPLVEEYIEELLHGYKYDYNKFSKEIYNIWIDKFVDVSKKRCGESFNDKWENIECYILPTIESALQNIKVINGDSEDILDYSISDSGDYVVIGGNKLSRGLTLEGLIVSYYYRRSRMYDSLLQMGRWFGFRKGWIDLCRVFTTKRFMNDFIMVGKALELFKDDLRAMNAQNLNPTEVGQRIKSSPRLLPTSRNKMRTATEIKVSFSNSLQQVISYSKDTIDENFKTTDSFIRSLKNGEVRENGKIVFHNISPKKIIEYLSNYKDAGSSYDIGSINVQNWINYINNRVEDNELGNWTVVLSSLKTQNIIDEVEIGGYKIIKPTRSLRTVGNSDNLKCLTVKANSIPKDFAEFYDPDSNEYKSINHYDTSKTYPGFDENHALMAIYVTDLYEKEYTGDYDKDGNKEKTRRTKRIEDATNVCSPAIWFPRTQNYMASLVSFYASKGYLEQERKQLALDDEMFGKEDNDE